jgi:hypothetical protein
MISRIKYQMRVRKLNRERDRIERVYKAKRAAMRLRGEAVPSFLPEEWNDQNFVNAEISKLETGDLLGRAARMKVPIPDSEDDEAWLEAVGGGYFLSAKAYYDLRAAIRKEQNERWQWLELRSKLIITVATSLTGLVGALIGWAAFLKK